MNAEQGPAAAPCADAERSAVHGAARRPAHATVPLQDACIF